MRELNEGVIKFSLGHYNFNVLVENNEVIDFIIEKSKNNFSKIYFCWNNPAEDEMTEEEYETFESNNSRIIDFISEIYNIN